MAKKKAAEGSDAIRALIVDNPTASNAQIAALASDEDTTVTPDEVGDVRAEMGPRHTWKES